MVTAEVDVPYAVLKNLLDTEAIRDVPYQCDLRMDQMDEGFTENESSMLTLMTSMTGEVEVKDSSTISGNTSDLSQLSNRASVCGASATAANK